MQEYKLDLVFKPSAKKFLDRCERNIYYRILEKTNALKRNPFPSDCKRVENQEEKVFRIRVGEYRILYTVSNKQNTLLIIDINKRSNIYKVKEEAEKSYNNSSSLPTSYPLLSTSHHLPATSFFPQ